MTNRTHDWLWTFWILIWVYYFLFYCLCSPRFCLKLTSLASRQNYRQREGMGGSASPTHDSFDMFLNRLENERWTVIATGFFLPFPPDKGWGCNCSCLLLSAMGWRVGGGCRLWNHSSFHPSNFTNPSNLPLYVKASDSPSVEQPWYFRWLCQLRAKSETI